MKSLAAVRDYDERGPAALAPRIAITTACIRRNVATQQVAGARR